MHFSCDLWELDADANAYGTGNADANSNGNADGNGNGRGIMAIYVVFTASWWMRAELPGLSTTVRRRPTTLLLALKLKTEFKAPQESLG